ncbi:MAG TPA: hypothetical protein VFA45_08005 [Actinomycetes bacterium]|nr:hypothetical protein [Actinomycetes bacterium]
MLRGILRPPFVAAVLGMAALALLAVRGAEAFDQRRHAALAREVTRAADTVTRQLPAVGAGARDGVRGRLQYRPRTWLSVVSLEGLPATGGRERYLVFLHNWSGWMLAGAVSADARGQAQVRFGGEPRPPSIFEVIVTRAVDDASSDPHGTPVLHWFDASLAPRRAVPFDFDRGS